MKKALKLLCLIAVVAALLVTAALAAEPFSITVTDSHINVSPESVSEKSEAAPLTINLTPKPGYKISNVTGVSVGGSPLDASSWACVNNTSAANITIQSYSSGEISISATAEECTYTITLEVGSGKDSHTSAPTFTYGTASVNINDPTAPEGYTFVGWTITSKTGNWTDISSSLVNSPDDYITLNTAEKYGDLTLTANYGQNTGALSFDSKDDNLTYSKKDNVLTISLKDTVDEDEYSLPLFVTVTKTVDGTTTTLIESTDVGDDDADWDYTYDHDSGEVIINKTILSKANVTVTAEADDVKDIFVQVEHSGVVLTEGSSWANVKKDYKLVFEAAGDGVLPTYATVEFVAGKDESWEIEAEYSAKKGTLTISKATLAELFDDENLKEKNFAKQTYYLLITIQGKTEGRVNLTTKGGKNGKTTITDGTKDGKGMTLDAALAQIDADIKNSTATSAVIELLGDCSTEKQITVAEDFALEITAEESYILTSTYTNKKAAKNHAIVLEEDAELELDIAGLFYKADVAIFDAEAGEDEEDVTEKIFPSSMTITGEELEGTYLLSKDGYGFAEALSLAKEAAKASDDEVELNVQSGKYTEKNAVTLAEDVSVILQKDVSLTLKKALNLNGQTIQAAGTVSLKSVSGKGSLLLDDADAVITCEVSIKDLVATTLPVGVNEEKAEGSFTYTLSKETTQDEPAAEAEEPSDIDIAPAPQTGTISVICGVGGTASPASFTLAEGGSQTVTISQNTGYILTAVTVNGTPYSISNLLATTTGYILNWTSAEDASIVLTFSLCPSFNDVNTLAWYYSDVMFTTAKGLMVGFPSGGFGPTDTMTVAQYLTVMYRYLQAQTPALIPSKATTGSAWTEGADYVNATYLASAYQNITTTQLTRYAVADITYRVLKALESYTGTSYGTGEPLSFSDVPTTDPYYSAVSYLSTVNIIDGYVTGSTRSYAGANTISRAEIAKVLHRLMLVDSKTPITASGIATSSVQAAPAVTPSGKTVYVTETGDKYHLQGCVYLEDSSIAVDKAQAIAGGYTACLRCDP